MSKIDVLGLKIDDVNLIEAKRTIQGWILASGNKKHYIVTPNPEFCVLAQTDTYFKNIINNADLAIPDGSGLRISGKVKNTLPGTDLMMKLISLCSEKGFTIGLIGGSKNLAEKLSERLKKQYPALKIIIADSNFLVDRDGNISTDSYSRKILSSKDIKDIHPNLYKKIDLLFVAFGQGKQEKWIGKNINFLNAKVLMGIGGAFDYLSGQIPRAPKWLRNLGLEWLFRLITQPWRLKRQLALLKYLWLLVTT